MWVRGRWRLLAAVTCCHHPERQPRPGAAARPSRALVLQNPSPNAYTLAIAGRKPFIVVHSALLELLAPAEVQAVLAHELGHLKCDHGVWLTAANVIASGTVSVRPPFLADDLSSRRC